MTLGLPGELTEETGNDLFKRNDVRETTSIASAPNDAEFVTLIASNGLVNERVLTAGEGIDLVDAGAGSTITINGEDATTSNKGIASFNSTDFSVSSGAVSLKNKTSFYSFSGNHFTVGQDSDAFSRSDTGRITANATNVNFIMPINLPHNAVVTSVVVFGSETDETWTLKRHTTDSFSTVSTMASAAFESTDSSISNATIDNSTFDYFISTTSLDSTDAIHGGRITYTTDYD